ncbi:MAG: substrate-binding domain-containing protein, partial [Propionibacteriaceae bacterium]|nr:substrate-binding domain-containing protein [Propionibacteriaceae bacterium]
LIGFAQALTDHGLPLRPEYVVRARLDPESARAETEALLMGDDPPDAIYAVTASLTLGSSQALRTTGQAANLGMVGQDDDRWASLVQPAVSVIQQPTTQMGKVAAAQLLRRVGGDDGPAASIVMEPKLVVRESSLRR